MDRFLYTEQSPSSTCSHCECDIGSDELVCVIDDGFLCEDCYYDLKDKFKLNNILVRISEYI